MLYWTSQMAAAYAISFTHDCRSISRRSCGIVLLDIVAMLGNARWGCTIIIQLIYTHRPQNETIQTDYPNGLIDFKPASHAAGPIALYCFMGVAGALAISCILAWRRSYR
ncbi:hypothetical protein BX070DRAFT_230413 [Coemansia spiralis]|nr:hypothetical protein BX070DRAFT_230413 [Coemansia spiralis]